MMTFIAILFWMWFLVSVVILVRRAIRRRADKRARREGMQAVLHEPPVPGRDRVAAEADALESLDQTDATLTTWAADATREADSAAGTNVPSPPSPPAPSRAVPAETEPSAPPATPAPAPATVAPAPGPARVATMARTATSPVTVAQVIAGIEMPCGLVPLTLSDHDMRYDRGQRAQFFTTDVPAAVVGTALADELERIGLTVSPIGDTAAVAQRGRLAVEMRIVTVGELIDGVASTEYRSAPPNSVVVEFDVVTAP